MKIITSKDPLTNRTGVIGDIDELLLEHLDQLCDKAARIHPRYQKLIETVKDSVLPGGKRNRPYLCLLTAAAYGSDTYARNIRTSLFLEFIHLAGLIHDDIIDNDTIRHGRLNINGTYEKTYAKAGSKQSKDMAGSTALIAGDILISEAFRMLYASGLPPSMTNELAELLAESNFRLLGGELLDTDGILYKNDEQDTIIVNQNKTAFYSFVLPLTAGALLAEAPKSDIPALQAAGLALGSAFQLHDDLIGTFGDPSCTGKSAEGDIKEGKRTLLFIKSLELTKGADQKFLAIRYGAADVSAEEIGRIRAIIASCGAKERVEQEIARYQSAASKQLEQLKISSKYKSAILKIL